MDDRYLMLRDTLTPREWQVVDLVIEGYTNLNIAQHHGVTENTVRRQIQCIFQKMGVLNRTELAVKVLRQRHAEEMGAYLGARSNS